MALSILKDKLPTVCDEGCQLEQQLSDKGESEDQTDEYRFTASGGKVVLEVNLDGSGKLTEIEVGIPFNFVPADLVQAAISMDGDDMAKPDTKCACAEVGTYGANSGIHFELDSCSNDYRSGSPGKLFDIDFDDNGNPKVSEGDESHPCVEGADWDDLPTLSEIAEAGTKFDLSKHIDGDNSYAKLVNIVHLLNAVADADEFDHKGFDDDAGEHGDDHDDMDD